MTPAELRAALADLGLTQSGFARLARVDPRTVRRWVAGDAAVPGPVVVLLDLLAAYPEARQAMGRDFLPAGALAPPLGAGPPRQGRGAGVCLLPRRSRGSFSESLE